MKAVLFNEVGKTLEVRDVPMPQAGPGELLVKVAVCGICGSDLHIVEVPGLLQDGQIMGHEYAGTVAAVGPGVGAEWQVGDRLISLPVKPCGGCPACLGGDFRNCASFIIQGYDPRFPGAYAEYVTCMAAVSIKLPDGFDFRDAALIEPLAVGLSAYKNALVADGACVLIVGAGVIGLTVALWARFFGAGDVVVSEMVPSRIERARKVGADLVIDASTCENPVAECQRLTGRTPSVIFECVGRPMMQKLVDMAPQKAHLVMVGTGMQPDQVVVAMAALKRLRMSFAFGSEPEDFGFVLRMLAAGRIRTDGLVTGTVGIDQVPEQFALLQRPNDHCKVLIAP